ncbi:MAG: hypothetical protein ACJA13_000459 [Paraglaciecola sp.]|jgi:hypothetical protein
MQHTVSSKTLLKASVSATLAAIVALISFILPAEYNFDPTGIGHKLGLTVLSAASQKETPGKPASAGSDEYQVIDVTVPAKKGIEYKFSMQQNDKMTYQWLTDGSALYFDLHGEPQGDTSGYFESYAIATLNEMKGSFTAPFNGAHGWYWKNKSDKPIAVQLMVKGQYKVIGLKP